MAITFPKNTKEISDRMKADVQNALPQSNPFLQNSYLAALIYGYSGRLADNYVQLNQALNEMFMDTADGTYLERWGTYVNITRNPATQARGYTNVTGNLGVTVPLETELQNSSGDRYITTTSGAVTAQTQTIADLSRSGILVTANFNEAHNLSSGMSVTISGADQPDYNGTYTIVVIGSTTYQYEISTSPITPATGSILSESNFISVKVKSEDFGFALNMEGGSVLQFTTPIAGIDTDTYVQYEGLTDGVDIESDEALRARILIRYQKPVANFNDATLETKALEVPGVTRVWVTDNRFHGAYQVGTASIYFVEDNNFPNIGPSVQTIEDVTEAILNIKPANTDDDQIYINGPDEFRIDFEFAYIDPDTSTMRTAIENSLIQFFRERANLGEDIPNKAYVSAIYETIDTETGDQLRDFGLLSPVGDIPIGNTQLAMLDNVIFNDA